MKNYTKNYLKLLALFAGVIFALICFTMAFVCCKPQKTITRLTAELNSEREQHAESQSLLNQAAHYAIWQNEVLDSTRRENRNLQWNFWQETEKNRTLQAKMNENYSEKNYNDSGVLIKEISAVKSSEISTNERVMQKTIENLKDSLNIEKTANKELRASYDELNELYAQSQYLLEEKTFENQKVIEKTETKNNPNGWWFVLSFFGFCAVCVWFWHGGANKVWEWARKVFCKK